jgi:hypothetical protein
MAPVAVEVTVPFAIVITPSELPVPALYVTVPWFTADTFAFWKMSLPAFSVMLPFPPEAETDALRVRSSPG